MKNDLLADYFINEYIPLNPTHTKTDLMTEFFSRAERIDLPQGKDELIFEAFTHKSFAHESKLDLNNNERLEFLGDSVLQLIVSETLMALHPEAKEGKLSKLRSSIVNEASLGELAREMGLNKLIMLGKGELGERGYEKPSLLSNCFEAYLGALYLSEGFEKTKARVLKMFQGLEKRGRNLFDLEAIGDFDAKSRLQEILVKESGEPPKYVCSELNGDKEKLFHIVATVNGQKLGELSHKSKKKGMQALAKKILQDREDNEKKQ